MLCATLWRVQCKILVRIFYQNIGGSKVKKKQVYIWYKGLSWYVVNEPVALKMRKTSVNFSETMVTTYNTTW